MFPSLLSSRRGLLAAFFCFSSSVLFVSFLSLASLREKFRHYATPPSLFPLPGRTEDQKNTSQCHPNDFVSGYWMRRPTAKPVYTHQDALRSSGILGCASNREYGWHLGLEWGRPNEEFPYREWRGNVSAYDWIPGEGCEAYRRVDRELFVIQLVEEGGWLVLGGVYYDVIYAMT